MPGIRYGTVATARHWLLLLLHYVAAAAAAAIRFVLLLQYPTSLQEHSSSYDECLIQIARGFLHTTRMDTAVLVLLSVYYYCTWYAIYCCTICQCTQSMTLQNKGLY